MLHNQTTIWLKLKYKNDRSTKVDDVLNFFVDLVAVYVAYFNSVGKGSVDNAKHLNYMFLPLTVLTIVCSLSLISEGYFLWLIIFTLTSLD